MDGIRISKVDNVTLEKQGVKSRGILHVTLHHLIFSPEGEPELWTPYPLINLVTRLPQTFNGLSPIAIRTRTFESFTLTFQVDRDCVDVFESVKDLTVAPSIEKLYAFSYSPQPPLESSDGWQIYQPRVEFTRMGVGSRTKAWRFTDINKDYSFSTTYPAKLVVPAKISDSVLTHASKYRSKERLPALTYLHWANHASMTRSSQPMVGLKSNRSIQDEKLIECIFQTHLSPDSALSPLSNFDRPVPSSSRPSPSSASSTPTNVYGSTKTNLIVDARPTTNALANTAKGAGTENMENYKGGKKAYLGIDNIHVMRDSLRGVVEALRESEIGAGGVGGAAGSMPLDRQALKRSGWLKHSTTILEGSNIIVRNIHINSSHVLIHCSDGWDRTAQLAALSQLCLDPFYRTLEGFQILVEKDFLSFGHKFLDRCGHLSSDKFFTSSSSSSNSNSSFDDNDPVPQSSTPSKGGAAAFFASVQKQFSGGSSSHLKETSPVFHQFLDCVRQIQRQFPSRFEFNEAFLRALHTHLYSCQFGTFIFNSERDRRIAEFGPRHQKMPMERTVSIWDWVNSEEQKKGFLNEAFRPELDDRESRERDADMGVLLPNPRDVQFWYQLFGRGDEEMNGRAVVVQEDLPAPPSPAERTGGVEDPVIEAVVRESEAVDSGSSTPVLPRDAKATSIGDAAPIPYEPRVAKGGQGGQGGRASPVGSTEPFRPFSTTASNFSLQQSSDSSSSNAFPSPSSSSSSQHQTSFPTARLSSPAPFTQPSSNSYLSNPTSSNSSSSSSGGGGWGWGQISSGATSFLSGAAKEISRVAAGTATSSSSASSGSSSASSRAGARASEQQLVGGGGWKSRSLAAAEANPWAASEPDACLTSSSASSATSTSIPINFSSFSASASNPRQSETHHPSKPTFTTRSISSWEEVQPLHNHNNNISFPNPSPQYPSSPLSSSSTVPRNDFVNPLGGTADDWASSSPSTSSSSPFRSASKPPPPSRLIGSETPSSINSRSTSPARLSPLASASTNQPPSLSDLTLVDPTIYSTSKTNTRSTTSSSSASTLADPRPPVSRKSSGSPAPPPPVVSSGNFDPLGVL